MREEFGSTLMDIDDLAIYLKVAKQTIYNWLGSKKIPGIKLGYVWRFQKEQIDTWLLTKSVKGGGVLNVIHDTNVEHIFTNKVPEVDTFRDTGHPVEEFKTEITSEEKQVNTENEERTVELEKKSIEVEESQDEGSVNNNSMDNELPKAEGYMGKT